MKKLSLLKGLVVVILSTILVASLGSFAFAADDDWDGWETAEQTQNSTTNTNTKNTTNTNSAITTNTTTNTATNTNTGNVTANLSTNTTNTNNTSVNTLAHTGIEDNSVLAIVVVLGVIVAAYSFKKVKDYNNL